MTRRHLHIDQGTKLERIMSDALPSFAASAHTAGLTPMIPLHPNPVTIKTLFHSPTIP